MKKANNSIVFLWSNLKLCPAKLKEVVYNALTASILENYATSWDMHPKKDIYIIEKVQCRGARFVVYKYHITSSVIKIFKDLNWKYHDDRCRTFRLTPSSKPVTQCGV